jgi:hypothetical protein
MQNQARVFWIVWVVAVVAVVVGRIFDWLNVGAMAGAIAFWSRWQRPTLGAADPHGHADPLRWTFPGGSGGLRGTHP